MFDYKSVLKATGPNAGEHLRSVQRTACSLANSSGGFILFGVQDRRVTVPDPRDRIVGIPLDGDLRKEFGDKMKGLQPDIHFDASPKPIALPENPARGVFVVRIPLSPNRPHMVWRAGVFYKRSEGGSAAQMDVYEIRDQMLFTEELQRKLTLLRLEIDEYLLIAHEIRRHQPRPFETYLRFDTSALKTLVADVTPLLPEDLKQWQLLLSLPSVAAAANRVLDEAHQAKMSGQMERDPRMVGTYGHAVDSAVQQFEELCRRVEGMLDDSYGPLGRGLRRWP